MLDQKTTVVLSYLNAVSEGGGYKILSEKEALSALPPEANISAETFRETVRFLKERELIAVKYEGEGEYCFTTLPKGRTLLENGAQAEGKHNHLKNIFALAFLGGFLGGALGALLVALWV